MRGGEIEITPTPVQCEGEWENSHEYEETEREKKQRKISKERKQQLFFKNFQLLLKNSDYNFGVNLKKTSQALTIHENGAFLKVSKW